MVLKSGTVLCLTEIIVYVYVQETTLYLQLLYKNEFKDQFLSILRVKYENMIFLAMGNSQYMKNYTHLDTNLDRGTCLYLVLLR